VLLKATKVDGVYTADPRKDPTAKRYDTLTFPRPSPRPAHHGHDGPGHVQEKNVPILVFDFKRSGNIRRVVEGERRLDALAQR
jgi:uridylate kinase